MSVASIVKKLTYLGREGSPGTGVAANKYLQGLNLRLIGNNTRGQVRPSGSLLETDSPEIQDWSTFSIAAGSSLDYNSLLYILAGAICVPTTSTPGGATNAREHAGIFLPDGSAARAAYTMITGYRGGTAEKSIRNVFAAFGFTFSRTAAPGISGTGYGRNLDFSATLGVDEIQTFTINATGGTFDGSCLGTAFTGYAWNISAATLQTNLRALAGVGGANLTVTGGPGGTAPLVITFIGTKANTDVALITIDSTNLTGGSHTGTVVETQKGGITTVPVKAIQAPELDIFVDDTAGAIGTTKVRHYSGEFTLGGLTEPDWVVDSDLPSYEDDVVLVPTLTFNLVGRNDANFRTLRSDLKAGATKYLRFRAQAAADSIESGQRHLFQMDMAVKARENIGQLGEDGGRETLPLPLKIVSDSTFASGGFSYLLRNALASL